MNNQTDLGRIVEQGGGDYIGMQEAFGPVPDSVMFNDARKLTESTMMLPVAGLSAEKVEEKIRDKRLVAPTDPGLWEELQALAPQKGHPAQDLKALPKAGGNPHPKEVFMDQLDGRFPQNGHPPHDLKALFRAEGLPERLKEQSLSVDGVVFGDETDRVFDNLAMIEKSMEITGVGEEIRLVLQEMDAI